MLRKYSYRKFLPKHIKFVFELLPQGIFIKETLLFIKFVLKTPQFLKSLFVSE